MTSVLITCCKLLTVLMCVVIEVSRMGSDRVSDLIEINNALVKPNKQTNKQHCCGTSFNQPQSIGVPYGNKTWGLC